MKLKTIINLLKKDFDKDELINCFNNNTYNDEFLADGEDAIKAGLEGTPHTLIYTKMIVVN